MGEKWRKNRKSTAEKNLIYVESFFKTVKKKPLTKNIEKLQKKGKGCRKYCRKATENF